MRGLFDTLLTRFKRGDVLYNNVAVLPYEQEPSVEMWDYIMGINLRCPFPCSKHAIPPMLKQGEGSILNLSSPSGLYACAPTLAAYIWVAESKSPSLFLLTMEGNVDVVATQCDGEPFLFPNDLYFSPECQIFLTDSGVWTDSSHQTIEFGRVTWMWNTMGEYIA